MPLNPFGQPQMPSRPQLGGGKPQYNPDAMQQAGGKTFAWAGRELNQLPSQQGAFNQAQNPYDIYRQGMPGAQQAFQNGLGGGYRGPQGNPFMPQGGQGGGQGGVPPWMQQLPNAPNIQGANTNFQQPQMGGLKFGNQQYGQFDPNSVQGPNTPQFRDPNFQGPQTNVPGFGDIVGQARGLGGAANVPRENLQRSGYENSQLFGNPNSVATQGFQSALGASQGLANTGGVDLSGLNQAMDEASKNTFARAAEAGQNIAGARGFTDPSGTVAGGEIGTRLGEAATQDAAARQSALLNAMGQQQQGRIAGAGQLASLGGTASQAALGMGGLAQNEAQGLNQLGVTQRGQDIGQSQFGAGQFSQNLNALGGLAGTLGGLQNQGFGLGTERGLGMGNLGVNQAGLGLQGYQVQTQRMGTQGDIYNQGNANNTNLYGQQTQRGIGEGQYGMDQANLGLGYAGLNSQNANNNAQNAINLYGTQGNLGNAWNQNMGQYYLGQQGINQGWGQMWQQGQIEAGNQNQNAGNMGLNYMNSGANAMGQMNDLRQRAAAGDQQAAIQLYSMLAGDVQQGNANRSGGIGGVLGGIGGTLLGAATGGVGSAAGNWLGGKLF